MKQNYGQWKSLGNKHKFVGSVTTSRHNEDP